MGVMQMLRERLESGATVPELEAEGFVKSSIYSAKKGLRPKSKSGQRSTVPSNSGSSNPPTHIPRLSGNDANDPELGALRLELAKLKLQSEIRAVGDKDKRLEDLSDQVKRLQEWTIHTLSSLAEATTEVDYDSLHSWRDSQLKYLRGELE